MGMVEKMGDEGGMIKDETVGLCRMED